LLIKSFFFTEFLLGTFGFLTGLTFHGIYHYKDWYKIFTKKDKRE
jgi:hypothetical protein